MSKVKIVTWNIHGAALHKRMASAHEIEKNTAVVASVIKSFDADIILLQEVHTINAVNQLNLIGQSTGFPYSTSCMLDNSHIILDEEAKIGIGILSKFKIQNSASYYFSNPNLEGVQEDGDYWQTHNKGVITADIEVNNIHITVACLHLLPLHKFITNLTDSTIYHQYIETIGRELGQYFADTQYPLILGGDFNMNDIDTLLHFSGLNLNEVKFKDPTIGPYNFDHILIHNSFQLLDYRVMNEHHYSDHYACFAHLNIL